MERRNVIPFSFYLTHDAEMITKEPFDAEDLSCAFGVHRFVLADVSSEGRAVDAQTTTERAWRKGTALPFHQNAEFQNARCLSDR